MAKLEAEESNRLKTEFLHNISHEIRTPLNSIIGFSTILAQPNTTDEDRAAYLDVVLQSTRDLMRMMDNVIELSRLETCRRDVRMDTIQLNNLLQSFVYQYLPLAQHKNLNLELRSGLPDAEATVKSDVALLSRILNNLLDNAVKFTDSGHIELGYRVEGQELTLYVNDTGIGIAAENIERIFERFVQEEIGLTRGFGGLGLGLSISKESAALLNARLWVESQKGRGSTFYLTIPYIP
jgi:signal transduction histidine kinase